MGLSTIRKTTLTIMAIVGLIAASAIPAAADSGTHRSSGAEHGFGGDQFHFGHFHFGHGHISHTATCSGTIDTPGVLAGNYFSNVVVKGVCFVNGGSAKVFGDLTVAPGSAFNATFALNDLAGTGTSSLTVKGDLNVGPGAILAMGCEPGFSICTDDPDQTNGTLTGPEPRVRKRFVVPTVGRDHARQHDR